MPSSTPPFPPRGRSWQEQDTEAGQAALWGAMAAPRFCATGWQPSLGWRRPQKGRSKHFGSTVMGAESRSPALRTQKCQHRSGSCGQNCAVREGRRSQVSVALKLCRVGWGRSPSNPQVRQSGSQPHRACPCQSEVKNRHIKEVTDTFTLVQVVDIIMVAGGWRKTEQRGKHF